MSGAGRNQRVGHDISSFRMELQKGTRGQNLNLEHTISSSLPTNPKGVLHLNRHPQLSPAGGSLKRCQFRLWHLQRPNPNPSSGFVLRELTS